MTNDKARDLLSMIEVKEPNELIVNSWWGSFAKDYKEAFEIAIKALEQEPCEDAISRAEVLDLTDSKDPNYEVRHFKEDVECLDSVICSEKQNRWIPVSERLPKDHENVLIYLSSNQITIGSYNSHRLPFMDKPIGWGTDAPHGWSSDDVVAWMPLPDPYGGDAEWNL